MIKRISVTVCFYLFALFVSKSQTFLVDGINYSILSSEEPRTVEVISKNPVYAGNVIIPSTVEYLGDIYNVTGIRNFAFLSCKSVPSIEIPASVLNIGIQAFQSCSNLTALNVASDNSNYTSINGILYNKDITILVRFPEGKTSVLIPNSVTSIGNCAFYSCTGLTSIVIPNSVISIGQSAFYLCTGLISIEIPNSVIDIGNSAFSECSGLRSIIIPNSVTSFGGNIFYGCESLTTIEIPSSVTSIGVKPFYGCTSLISIDVAIDNSYFASLEGVLYNKDFSILISCPARKTNFLIPGSVQIIKEHAFNNCKDLTSIIIPDMVTSIETGAFIECAGLTSIVIPNSVKSIGNGSFMHCVSLISFVIPDSITSIGNGTFSGCTGLTSIFIPNSVKSFGGSVFNGCTSLTSIEIPNSITSIGGKSFYSCTGLTSITCHPILPPTLESYVFTDVPKTIPLYVPGGSIDAYKNADQWKDFLTILPISTVNTESLKTTGLTVYPNPVTDRLILKGIYQNTTINIYDLNGQHVFLSKTANDNESLDVSFLQPGVYLLGIFHKNGETSIARFIKE